MEQNPLLRNLQNRDILSEAERTVLATGNWRHRRVEAGADIVREGQSPTESCLMLSGYSARYHLLSDGRRQISAIHIAGDFVDLHSFLLDRMDHSVGAITDVTIALVPHHVLREFTESQPHLTRMLWLSTLIDAAMHRRWLMAAGRLNAVGRVAHLICEMHVRLDVVGHVTDRTFRLPLSQTELSDAMGLSVVHINRTLQQLRKQGLISWQGETVRILDWPALQEVAEFDPAYLNLGAEPR